ncbi:MAG: AAA family ATPase [Planctomycetota bacterium]
MLTRFEVRGFKNLVDVDLHLGPMTCIAGPNAVGKSNLFDAIKLMRELANRSIVDAFSEVRRGSDELESLFTWGGSNRIELAAEMLIPESGVDDFGQEATAVARYLRYELSLELVEPSEQRIRLVSETLRILSKTEAVQRLRFEHSPEWLDSIFGLSIQHGQDLITTEESGGKRVVRLLQERQDDDRRGDRHSSFPAENLPRTVLSSAQNASESGTAVLVRREMRNWRILGLEPSALHGPDTYKNPEAISEKGEHLPGTLQRLCQDPRQAESADRLLARVANRLAELVEGVQSLRVERDDSRKLLTLMLRDTQGHDVAASALSDGTLRFLALVILENDPEVTGLVCLEEPENGIHPGRLIAMLRLLEDMACDTQLPVDVDNPLRQILVNTHSPSFAAIMPEDALLFARIRPFVTNGRQVHGAVLQALDPTWRTDAGFAEAVAPGSILSYLEGSSGLGLRPISTAEIDERRRDVVSHVRRQLRLFGD